MSTRATIFALLTACALAVACQGKPLGHPSRDPQGPDEHTRRDLELSPAQAELLASLAERADRHPGSFEALRASGLAHMNFTLAGVLRLRDRAERDLEAAFALDSSDATLNRSLGRFYNLRAVAGDTSKAQMQVKVYAALLGDQDPAAMSDSDFVAYSFFMLGQILSEKNRGRKLRALAKVSELEAQLAERVRRQPDNMEFRALAGNFAFFFAGNIPLARERRVSEGVAYFEVLRARWDELRPGARHPDHCPNTYENFMFELAEGYMVLERGDQARPIYRELGQIRPPRTRAKELIAHVSEERLRNFDAYLGEMLLMPPWPSDEGNCVVCHAWTSDVPLSSLHAVEEIRLSELPSKAQRKPIDTLLNMDDPTTRDEDRGPARIEGREQLPEALAELIEAECARCHFPGRPAVDMLDLSRAAKVIEHAEWIEERTSAGAMPPDRALSDAQQQLIRSWRAKLDSDGL